MKRIAIVLLLFLCAIPPVFSEEYIRYPAVRSDQDRRDDYPIKLLHLALQKSDMDYQLIPTMGSAVQSRSLANLASGKGVDVVWTMTSIKREEDLLPIRVPIYKGLIGWRLFLYVPASGVDLADVTSATDLKKWRMIQGHDWPDTKILRHNGFQVQGSPGYGNIFRMVKHQRAHLFPRSMSEIWAELDTNRGDGFEVEPHVMLHYPAAVYFFVSPSNLKLRDALLTGLNRALDDGSFDALFQEYHADLIAKAHLRDRVVIELENPLLPKDTPLSDTRLWFHSGFLEQKPSP